MKGKVLIAEACMQAAVQALFARYESLTNDALSGRPDLPAIRDLYETAWIGSSPVGVMGGKNDEDFDAAIRSGFAFNQKIGTQRMSILSLRVSPVDALHALAHVEWRAAYRKDGAELHIDFTNIYLTRIMENRARVFGWITGDEEAALREHGLL